MSKIRNKRYFSVELKRKVIEEIQLLRKEGFTATNACSQVGVSRSQYYRWLAEYRKVLKGDINAMQPKSRRPKRLARQTSSSMRQQVLQLARSRKFSSANAISNKLREQGYKITTKTVISILEGEGLYGWIVIRDEAGKLLTKKRGLISH